VYDEIERRSDIHDFNVYISYLEIYNENAYDLLDREHLELPLEKWNKVTMYEDDDKNMHLKNLSVHYCENEKQGIDLMMMGNYIRKVSSTPMNMCSSRSHCIFTITLESKNKQTDHVYISKLHLVDLAGSERISRNQLEGNLLNETKYINLSLTYLEQVIVALKSKKNNKKRVHIPYRNSLMTTILKDSLGGNCRTTLIANLSLDLENVEETISTCRFAQRCS
jgi:kinesin family member 6/9